MMLCLILAPVQLDLVGKDGPSCAGRVFVLGAEDGASPEEVSFWRFGSLLESHAEWDPRYAVRQ